jgi:hypothetical protein
VHRLRDEHHEGVHEQRVGDPAQAVDEDRAEHALQPHGEEQDVQHHPEDAAEDHEALGAHDLGEHAGGPGRDGDHQAVDGEDEASLGGREAVLDEEAGQERELKTITGHEDGEGEIAEEQAAGHAEHAGTPSWTPRGRHLASRRAVGRCAMSSTLRRCDAGH